MDDQATAPRQTREGRRTGIKERLLADGSVTVEQLTKQYGVSVMTVHRDLDALADEGWLTRIRGGATLHPHALLDTTVRARSGRMIREKQAIARQALTHVQPNQVLLLDDSTTSHALAELLPADRNLTVVTNFLPTMTTAARRGLDLVATGGTYSPGYEAFLGLVTVGALSDMSADVLFMSTSAIDGVHCCHKSHETVQVKRAFLNSAATKILLADHTKFGQRALHRLASVAEFDCVIVDDGVPDDVREMLEEATPRVEVASTRS